MQVKEEMQMEIHANFRLCFKETLTVNVQL